jgi:hypothetical protein
MHSETCLASVEMMNESIEFLPSSEFGCQPSERWAATTSHSHNSFR